MILNNYAYFFNQLLISIKARRYYFDVRITRKLRPLARLLQTLNLIRRFHKVDNGKQIWRVFPAYSRNRKFSRELRTYARVRGKIVLNYQSLRLLNFNTPHSHYILETSVGIIAHKEALRRKIGGFLLAIVH